MFCVDFVLLQGGQIVLEGGAHWRESGDRARGYCSFGQDRLSTDNAVFDLVCDFLQTYGIRTIDWGLPYPHRMRKLESRIYQRSRENYGLELRAMVYREEGEEIHGKVK